jgi:hypothetical protein
MKVITAMDLARRYQCGSVGELYLMLAQRSKAKGLFQVMWDGQRVSGEPIVAFIDFGRWVARCECGQYNYVDPLEQILFCAKCGNGNSGMARAVQFPQESVRKRIEMLIMARPVLEDARAKDEIEAARLAKPLHVGLPRNWHPNQPVNDLATQNKAYGV